HAVVQESRSKSATENIFGSAQGLTEAFKEKMTMPTDVIERKLAERKGTPTDASRGEALNTDDVMMRVKEADQMTGTGFNDVGKMGEEGTGMKAAL
uniref:Uncharacterized protein n=1 Tax=Aegilops tauschii subsp. strangulata TaxID=200361 RepID=A0A453EQV1_AEGTS